MNHLLSVFGLCAEPISFGVISNLDVGPRGRDRISAGRHFDEAVSAVSVPACEVAHAMTFQLRIAAKPPPPHARATPLATTLPPSSPPPFR